MAAGSKRYSQEVGDRAVGLVLEHRRDGQEHGTTGTARANNPLGRAGELDTAETLTCTTQMGIPPMGPSITTNLPRRHV